MWDLRGQSSFPLHRCGSRRVGSVWSNQMGYWFHLIINGPGEDEDAASSSKDLRGTLDWEWWEAKVSSKPWEPCPARAQWERAQVKWDREREMLLIRADLSAFEENETTSDFLMLDFKCREMWREISILLKQLRTLMENYMQYIYVCVCVAELFALQRYRINHFKSTYNWMLQAIT